MNDCRLSSMRERLGAWPVSLGLVLIRAGLATLLMFVVAGTSFGDPTKFNLDATHSSLKVTGRAASPFGGTVPLQPQVTGSDTATYSGFLWANLNASGIQFPGSSNVAANNFVGPPLTPDNPANYGMKATILFSTANATVINLVFDLASGDLAVASNGTFSANTGTSATVTSGVIDYSGPAPIGSGSDSLVGSMASNQATASATLAIVGNTQTLTIPINATIPFTVTNPNDSTATFTGQLVAINTLVTPAVAFWQGNLDESWSTMRPTAATNWKTDASGASETLGLPGPSTDVFFTTSDHGSNLSTTLGANYSIKGLTFTSNSTSPVSIGGANTLTLGAGGLNSQSGAAAATINCPVVLGTSQTWSADGSNPLTVNGSLALGSSTLTKSGTGVVALGGAQSFGNNSAVNVNGGTLRYSATANAASVGTGVIVSVADGAQLELANSGSALSDGIHFVNVVNDSQLAAGGLLVSGANQRVGRVEGAGNVVVSAGGSLIATRIQQNSLEIGGDAGSHALVSIVASDASGNPLIEASPLSGVSSSLIATSDAASSDSFVAEITGATSLPGLDGSAMSLSAPSFLSTALGRENSPIASTAVPEPSSLLLAAIAAASLIVLARRGR
jgi:hypothetical protein